MFYYIYFKTLEKIIGIISVLFEINACECELHSILM